MKKEIKVELIILGTILLVVGFIGGIVLGLNKKNHEVETGIINNNSNIIKQENQINEENTNTDFSYFEELKNMEYYGTDGIDSCELKFDKNGKPLINIKYKNGTNEIVDNFTNIIADVAAGSTYVTFDFNSLLSNGSGTIQYSNVSAESPITITLEYSTGIEKIFDVDRIIK